MTDPQTMPDFADDHPDIENDAVIGTALRKSLMLFVAVAIPVFAFFIYRNINRERQYSVETEVTLPEVRETGGTLIPSLTMTEVSQQSGIDFVHQSGRCGDRLLPETMGSGVAVLDFNNDENLDILFVNSCYWPWDDRHETKTPCKLYAGNGNLQFTDVSEEAGLNDNIYGMGVAVADYDNDGDSDVFLSAVGRNHLYRNDDGRFQDVTSDASVGGGDDAWSTSCGFLDYNNDGLLDLFVCNYVAWSKENDLSQDFTLDGETRAYGPPRAFSGTYSYLYKNLGDGSFEDVSASSGIQIRNDDTDVPLGKAMGLAPVDVNRDGWIDLIVANDTVRNFLFENNRDGTFSETGRLSGIAFDRSTGNARGAMGIDTAAFRDDETLAIGIGNFANEASALYMTRPGRSQFIDAAMYTGFGPPTRKGLTFGLFFFDVDLDGRLDLLGANGHLEEEIAKTQSTQRYEQPPQLFWNAGREAKTELVLVDESNVGSDFHEPIVGRGAAFGDFDNDGDEDVVISTSHARPVLFRNDQATEHHYLRVKLEGKSCNRDAIGAIAQLSLQGRTLSRTVMPTRSYLSQCEKTVTFGLGTSEEADSITITWPGGSPERFEIKQVDQTVLLTQGEGTPVTDSQ
ncbi:CRTAC1 family protein [Rhodopirellula sallentina]|uniref:ASPIC/UnbV domain-containing protein n=1 Tax=Rhodopirellula sallentina SM41 TaxID=1263870 RepID=M5UAN3_9BACT|nr:CRTAC1 family protein [Rhodopirellula sallentina]EMI58359.1 ASPIC/UnbV domain-containing protein [Rhodopirellula sallentina SM41]